VATNTEKIDELFRIAHTLTERVDALREEVKGISPDLGRITDTLSQVATRLALLEQQLGEFKGWKDHVGVAEIKAEVIILKEQTKNFREDLDRAGGAELKTEAMLLKEQVRKLQEAADKRGNRAWSMVPNVVGAIVSVVLGALVAYFVAKKGTF